MVTGSDLVLEAPLVSGRGRLILRADSECVLLAPA